MKKTIVIAIIILSISFLLSKGYHLLTTDKAVVGTVQQQVSASASSSVETQSISTSSVVSLDSSVQSSYSSSIRPLSFPRVDPSVQAAHFLKSMDEGGLPKMQLPKLQKDLSFNYIDASAAQLKAKALQGDAYAAYMYGKYIRENSLRISIDGYKFRYESDPAKRNATVKEMREFYVRAMAGGVKEAAYELSYEYSLSSPWGNKLESLAWRKISFAVGESKVWDCLRDSTTCFVKEFNTLNSDEYFFPCVSRAIDNCKPENYQDATLLALQYAHSLEFAINNSVKK
jgi:hypothetical protein